MIATGSKPRIPHLDGLADVPYLTNETLFALDVLPEHLIILGAGAVGIEMAQGFRRLGAAVTVIAPKPALGRDDREAAELLLARLRDEGVKFETGLEATQVSGSGGEIAVALGDGRTVTGSHLMIATGRRANVTDLDLAAAGIETSEDGIVVDARRRTTNKRIYAIGDCRAGPRFTHVAGYEGSLVALDIALGLPGKVDWRALPHVTYTAPELAQIGLTEAEARKQHGMVEVTREVFTENDRAVTEGDSDGFLKLVRHRGRVVGVTIVGGRAGELLLPWAQIITGKSTAFALGSAIIAYPTRSEIAKAAAFQVYQSRVFGGLAETLGGSAGAVTALAGMTRARTMPVGPSPFQVTAPLTAGRQVRRSADHRRWEAPGAGPARRAGHLVVQHRHALQPRLRNLLYRELADQRRVGLSDHQ